MLNQVKINTLKQGLTLKTSLLGEQLIFKTRFGVFSPKKIDSGTKLLLVHLSPAKDNVVLDLGCGYGAIGLTLAKIYPKSIVYLIDKDFVALELCKQNKILNQTHNAHILLSDGFSHLPNNLRFNHIVSNMPAKVGKEQMDIFLFDAYQYMKIGGRITVASISGLKDYMKRHFQNIFGNYKKIKQSKHYVISEAIK